MRIIILILFSALSPSLKAMDMIDAFTGSRLLIGISAKDTTLSVQDPNDPFNVYGELTQFDFSYYPLLSFYTPDQYLSANSNWGWYVEFGWKNYYLNYQSDPNNSDLDPVNLGTTASGNFFHFTPVLFYNWGDRHIGKDGGQSYKFGIGIGIGYLNAKGDIIFTETGGATHIFNISGPGTSISVMFERRIDNFYIRVVGSGPSLIRNGNEYEIFDFSADIGYIFTI